MREPPETAVLMPTASPPSSKPAGNADRKPLRSVVILALAAALAASAFWAWNHYGGARAPRQQGAASPATAAATIGGIDNPATEPLLGSTVSMTGWALAREGVRAVEVRLDDRRYAAAIGIARPDVAQAQPGYPDSAAAGFAFTGDFSAVLAGDPASQHTLAIVVVARDGRETVLAEKRLISAPALSRWSGLLDQRPALAERKTRFLMMTSGVGAGGADGIDAAYRPYFTRTTQIGFAVPILYMRTTRGAAGDWAFDPDFDLSRRCGDRAIAEDSLNGVIRYAIERQLPVQFILDGGNRADAGCDVPQWDLNDHLEQDIAHCQWSQRDEALPDDHVRNRPAPAPQAGCRLTHHVYATRLREYKQRNLQTAAAIVARFAQEHPALFAGVVLDADTPTNPFTRDGRWYDYNPGMLKQFRHWLGGTGPYAAARERGVPDLASYRRAAPLALGDVNRLARKQWKTWDDVDPPRAFAGDGTTDVTPGGRPFWDDPWHAEWDTFRRHVVGLHHDELSAWVAAMGVPRDRIFSAQAFVAPEAGKRPVAVGIGGPGPDYDGAGVSIEGAIPRHGHLGAILYGPAAENRQRLANGHGLFSTFARMDPGWGIVEYNAADVKRADVPPVYAQSYRSFRDLFNFDGRQVALMAWNGPDGLLAGTPGYVPHTSWRNTPAEEAMRDFLVEHADLPRGARLWTFGTPRHADDDGWSLATGTANPGRGHLDLAFAATAVLTSPADQVLRAADIDTLVLGLADPDRLVRVQVSARAGDAARWIEIAAPVAASALLRDAAGLRVPLAWPAEWRKTGAIADQLRIALTFGEDATGARLHRIGLYPRDPKTR